MSESDGSSPAPADAAAIGFAFLAAGVEESIAAAHAEIAAMARAVQHGFGSLHAIAPPAPAAVQPRPARPVHEAAPHRHEPSRHAAGEPSRARPQRVAVLPPVMAATPGKPAAEPAGAGAAPLSQPPPAAPVAPSQPPPSAPVAPSQPTPSAPSAPPAPSQPTPMGAASPPSAPVAFAVQARAPVSPLPPAAAQAAPGVATPFAPPSLSLPDALTMPGMPGTVPALASTPPVSPAPPAGSNPAVPPTAPQPPVLLQPLPIWATAAPALPMAPQGVGLPPPVAPTGRASHERHHAAHPHHADHEPAGQSVPMHGDVFLDGVRVGRWLSDTMARAAGAPATGATAFDPRLGPRWPGALQGH